jgi:hypothetical protein
MRITGLRGALIKLNIAGSATTRRIMTALLNLFGASNPLRQFGARQTLLPTLLGSGTTELLKRYAKPGILL